MRYTVGSFGEESVGVVVDKSSMLEMGRNSKNRNGSMGFAWDLFQFFLFSKGVTVMMPKLNEITYKQWLPCYYKNHTFTRLLNYTYLGKAEH